MKELGDAESARAWLVPDEAAVWHRAAAACGVAGVRWDEAYCRWRESQALARHRTRRRDAVVALQSAYAMALELQAAPIAADLEVLARGARLPLSGSAPEPGPATDALPGLTAREREVLGFIMAGHTYAEIAHALFLSEKTVSVHVSNMLRKTGTPNRIELAQLAHRLGSTADRTGGTAVD